MISHGNRGLLYEKNNRIKITQALQNYKVAEFEIIFLLKEDHSWAVLL